MSDPHQRAAHVIVVEDDRGLWQRAPSWSRGTGLKEPTPISLASRPAAPAAIRRRPRAGTQAREETPGRTSAASGYVAPFGLAFAAAGVLDHPAPLEAR
jgi:hypothetical protein